MRTPRPLPPLVAFLLVLLACVSVRDGGDARAATSPPSLRIVPLGTRTLDDALASGARVLGRFPDAIVVANDAAAPALESGAAIDVPAGATITLLRRGPRAQRLPLDAAGLAAHGITLLWQDRADAIVASDGPPDLAAAGVRWRAQALRAEALPRATRVPAGPRTTSTSFAPVIADWVGQVSGPAMIDDIRRLSGGVPVTVGGSAVTLSTRSTPTVKCDQAEQYVYERFLAMGFTDVAYDPYTFSSTSARNVVATLPGVETPGHVIVLGAHLDSTSPQSSTNAPGANDNASGIAGLLETARILRQHSFRSTIRFIAFTGEEQGLYGSTHYANAAAARGDSIDAAVIYDMIGWHSALNQIDIEGESAWLPVMNVMDDACHAYTGLATQIQLFSFGSDHVPFQDVNIPAFLAIETEYDDYPCYHQTCDTTGWNQPVFQADVVKAGLATVAHLAGPRGFFLVHTPPPPTENTAGPYDIVASIQQVAAIVPDSLQLHWSTGGPVHDVTLAPTGTPSQYHATIPGIPYGTVRYWLSAADVNGGSARHPLSAPAALDTFVVASRETVFAEGFELGFGGWTSGGTQNDWQIGAPSGQTEDPATAHGGARVAGNDLSGLSPTPRRYESNADNWLESPPIDCSRVVGTRLAFWRDLAVERSNGGASDYARVAVNGTTVWESPSATTMNDAAWTLQTIDISALADHQSSVKVRFSLHSDAATTYGGWNVDDFSITAISPVSTTSVPTPAAPVLRLASAPNPARNGVSLRFELPRRADVRIAVYDVRGRLVRTLAEGLRDAGPHALAWDGRADDGHASGPGVYFCRLAAGAETLSRKLVLLR